ncbi:unnamed protein product [Parascedosporium putredinis]|uniref:Nitronate monooxygenase domain-containing protein n=1 Tax=Parascedosporium putredinis TaxID=1442378 RepID=A0A9P1M929_9PEZI|nr:unnamed protein product [Parascedosporium putredinis]CAI7991105.1 unnamed protein product [Parascedosporium putredinis]
MSTQAIRSTRLASAAKLAAALPWTAKPLIALAPMRPSSGPHLAVAVSRAGGIGFMNFNGKPEGLTEDFETAKRSLAESSDGDTKAFADFAAGDLLPIGVGFIVWCDDRAAATAAVEKYRPCAVWLFAPPHGQADLDEWTKGIRAVSPKTQVWIQVGTLQEATEAARSSQAPDVLVIQGMEAGGHGRAVDGIGLTTFLPEAADATLDTGIPLLAAGGIADARGVVSVLALGAAGAAMGTRFLASKEARVAKSYQQAVVDAKDGAKSTARTTIYNQLRGISWPERFSPRGVTNRTWDEYQQGASFDGLKAEFDKALGAGEAGWGPEGRLPTYAGAGVGLVNEVASAGKSWRRYGRIRLVYWKLWQAGLGSRRGLCRD